MLQLTRRAALLGLTSAFTLGRASLALAAVSAVGIIVGTALGQYLPIEWIKRVAGVAFVIVGVLILMGKF